MVHEDRCVGLDLQPVSKAHVIRMGMRDDDGLDILDVVSEGTKTGEKDRIMTREARIHRPEAAGVRLAQGFGEEDHTAVIRMIERMASVEIRASV